MTDALTVPVKYIFLDVVSFTRNRSVEAQSDIVQKLNEIVREAVEELKVKQENLIFLPTGDGMCICILNMETPYDVHMQTSLAILRRVQAWNDRTKDSMRQFKIRIGINANTDNVVTDINGNLNLAGAGINMAQRVMSSADENQIFVGSVVFETLQQREKYIDKFRGYEATIKHEIQLQVFQFVEEGHHGLNTEIPVQFRPKEEEPNDNKRLTVYAAYYLAHALRLQSTLAKYTRDLNAHLTWSIMLWILATDSEQRRGSGEFVKPKRRFVKYTTIDEAFDHYNRTDFQLIQRLGDEIEQEMRVFKECFSNEVYFGFHFISETGKERLRAEYPDIWKEFEFTASDKPWS